jgi:mono/diheme cytochrome c family protein
MKRLILVVTLTYAATLATAAQHLDGQQIFRFDTFGDEQLWTRTLQMQIPLASLKPIDALNAGLKVDVEALPSDVVAQLKANLVNLNDPAVTRLLLSVNAVVGVMGKVTGNTVETIGVTCALCHSTVDNSLATGIGRRLDGWPNRTLNVGAIVAMSPVLSDAQRSTFLSWGPGKFDPRLNAFDGTRFIELNRSTFPVVIPPAYGLRHVGFETFTADGPISYWNNYVAVTQMGGHGSFSDPRPPLRLNIVQTPDMVTPKLPALLDYQLSLKAPEPPRGSFDVVAAQRGRHLFNGVARCGTCHTPPAFTDVMRLPRNDVPLLHAPEETGMERIYASRTATGEYRTSPLAGVWQHPPYFHDGSAPDLPAVVNHYDGRFKLGLSSAQKSDLVEYLKSL